MKPDRFGRFLLLTFAFLGGLALIDYFLKLGTTRRAEFFSSASVPNPTPLDFPFEWIKGDLGPDLREALKRSPQGLIVNFWATWCEPCLEELPSLQLLADSLAKDRARFPQVLAISVDDNRAVVEQLLKRLSYPVTFPIARDDDGKIARTFGTSKFPETYWLTSEGGIRHKWIGPQNWVKAEVLELVSKPVAARVK